MIMKEKDYLNIINIADINAEWGAHVRESTTEADVNTWGNEIKQEGKLESIKENNYKNDAIEEERSVDREAILQKSKTIFNEEKEDEDDSKYYS
ncbi:MAG: aryl-alcohol dehydrogenase-like predicted oxidoreductase [Bacillariaceae sp.]|jgi:aryl-alcohol dehydrogenase-like predicted oxidoreductase